MCPGACESEYETAFIDDVDEKTICLYVTFPIPIQAAFQGVILVPGVELILSLQRSYDPIKGVEVFALFPHCLDVLLELTSLMYH